MFIKSNTLFRYDLKRKNVGHSIRFLWILRHAKQSNIFCHIIYYFLWKVYQLFFGLDIPYETEIGKGLYLGHAFNITVNGNAIIGDNCNLHKGCLIGQENRDFGGRKGAPKLGNKVWVGINAAIVGHVTVGDDVLIAPNSFVNCDIPSHSVVFGNPCIIKHKDNATEGYINNIV